MYYFRNDLEQKKPVNINVPHKKIKMGLNESTLNPFEKLGDKFIEKFRSVPLNRYFNDVTKELKMKLADYTGVPPECLTFGNGADEMLYYIFTAVRENNNSFAVSLAPSYFDYKSYTGAVGMGIKFLSLQPDFDFSVNEYLKFSDSKDCTLAILCNPNNPTGNLLNDKKITKVIENSSRLVLIDETYFEFSGKTFADTIEKYPNLVIVRSFSKAFSAAGLRFGYIISRPENIRELEKVMTIFHLNLVTQAFVVSILENKEIFLEHNRKIIESRESLYKELAEIPGISVHNTATNFLIFSIGERTEELFNFTSENNIAIRPVWHHPVLRNYVRVTISSKENNAVFLERVKEFTKKMIHA